MPWNTVGFLRVWRAVPGMQGQTYWNNTTNACYLRPPWLGPPLAALWYVTLHTSSFMDNVMFAHDKKLTMWKGIYSKCLNRGQWYLTPRRILKLTRCSTGQWPGWSLISTTALPNNYHQSNVAVCMLSLALTLIFQAFSIFSRRCKMDACSC